MQVEQQGGDVRNSAKESSPGSGDVPRRAWRPPRRTWWLAAAALVAAVSTAIAWTQPLSSDPFASPTITDPAWWLSPLERNAFRRLPVIAASLSDIIAAPGTEKLWAVGESGMIVHSPDGGRTWQGQGISARPDGATPRPALRKSAGPRLVAGAEAQSVQMIEVPSLERRTVGEAGMVLKKSELRLAGTDPKRPLGARDIVVGQRPAAGTRVPAGTTVVVDVLRPPSKAENEQAPVQQGPGLPRQEGTELPAAKKDGQSPRATPAQPPPPSQPLERPDLFGIHFVDDQYGWAVGEMGTILATADGGKRWERQVSPVTAGLRAVRFRDARTGWAVGVGGTIVATTDGGRLWQRQSSGTAADLRAVHVAATGGRAWVVGSGVILVTSNGGQFWALQVSGSAGLSAVHFLADGRRGWAAGNQGVILNTVDGGAQWQSRPSGRREGLQGIRFAADGQRGWAVGADGIVLTTVDGGSTWNSQASDTNADLRSIQLSTDGQRVWVVGAGGTVLTTSDAGFRWTRQTGGHRLLIRSLTVSPDGGRAGAPTAEGTVLLTSDGGQSWRARPTGTRAQLTDMFFLPDGRTGWLATSDGAALVTRNGGATWERQAGNSAWLTSIYFLTDGLRGWATAADGRILMTTDGGSSWRVQTTGQTPLWRVWLDAAGQRGWAIGNKGMVLATADGGARWQLRATGTNADLFEAHVAGDGSRMWIVGDRGTILATGDGGASWKTQVSGETLPLFSVHFHADGRRGWVVGNNGTILSTTNGGERWDPRRRGTKLPLFAVRFLDDGARGWAAGWGTILSTVDGGLTWTPVSHAAWPAPWYYASWLLVIGLLLPALKRPEPETAPQRSVADILVSDRPLEFGDPDPLGFGNVARGLSRFLRNEQTQPPLTIAVTGAWGSGKSSLMNLVKGDLQQRGFRPVWFNAWHHQKEEHLLAAMLQNIRAQAIPAWYSWGGLAFRTRLLRHRIGRRWRLLLPLVALASGALGYFSADPARLETALARLERGVERTVGVVTPLFPGGVNKALEQGKNALIDSGLRSGAAARAIPTGIALVVLLFMAYRGITAFGVSPADLMASVSGRTRRRAFEAKVGFRHEFAREFREVTRALNPRTMLILIDDLDRCRPENVLEVLESVNFLVSSGDCFVVMGMELDRVRRCVGLGFKDVAAELTDAEEAATGATPVIAGETDEGKRRRAVFAQQYLEKLINIEVPVPTPTESQAARVIAPDAEPAPPAGRWETLGADLAPLGRAAWPVAAVLVVLVAGFWSSVWWWPPLVPATPTSVIGAITTPEPVPSIPPPPGATSSPADRQRAPGVLVGGDAVAPSPWMASWPIAFLLLGGVVVFLIRPPIVVKDSDEFTKALAMWHPLVYTRHSTPRSAKRFVNRVRYYAMRQRDLPEERPIDRLAAWVTPWRRRQEAEPTDEPGPANGAIPEHLLVALSAIEHTHSDWLKGDRLFQDPDGFLAKQPLPQALRQALASIRLGEDLASHRQAFEKLSSAVHT